MTEGSYPPLKIGYLWQYPTVDMSRSIAPVLHVRAVIQGFERRGHHVRLLTFHQGQIQWTDDLTNWHLADIRRSQTYRFRFSEKLIRGIQSRLRLPFFSFFDSYRFSTACLTALSDRNAFYERYWLHSTGGLMAAKRLRIPLVYELNGDLFEEYNQLGMQLSRAQWASLKFINRLMFRKVDHIVSVSDILRERTIQRWGLDPARVSVVDNGVEINGFVNLENPEIVRARYNLDNHPSGIFVGNFRPWHGTEILLNAFRSVAAANLDAKLVLVGDSPLRADLEMQAESLGLADRVVFTGKVPHQDVPKLLNIASIAVLSHRPTAAAMAGSPMKLFEYMAAGKAIVAPALPNIGKILTHRENGLLVPPNNSEAMANALIELLSDSQLRVKMAQAAREEAIRKYSWDRAVGKLEHIIGDLLDLQGN